MWDGTVIVWLQLCFKFDFGLFIKEALNKWRPVEEGNAITEAGVLTGFIGLLPDIRL